MNSRLVIAIVLSVAAVSSSCDKKEDLPAVNRQLTAEIVFSSGETINFLASGREVALGCSAGRFVQGTMSGKTLLYISVSRPDSLFCFWTPGVYTNLIHVEFGRDITDVTSPRYFPVEQPGSNEVNLQVLTRTEMSGNFRVVCHYKGDTARIVGNFSGNIDE